MAFLKHIGKIASHKVVIVFREIPNEPHMCLVVYTQTLKQSLHEALMRVVEGQVGQSATDLSTALNRSLTGEGENLLHVLHREGLLKKAQTKSVRVTPTPTTSVGLDELNRILNEMKQGEAATKRLAEMDASLGMQSPVDIARRHRESLAPEPEVVSTAPAVFDDAALAANLRKQADQLSAQIQSLQAEQTRLLTEAESLSPVAKPAPKQRKPKVVKMEDQT